MIYFSLYQYAYFASRRTCVLLSSNQFHFFWMFNILLAPKSNCKTVQGMLISDWEALDRLYSPHGSNYRESILRTVNAGIDMVDETQTLYLDITFSQSSTSLILFPGDGAI